jgi:hypothetical protein
MLAIQFRQFSGDSIMVSRKSLQRAQTPFMEHLSIIQSRSHFSKTAKWHVGGNGNLDVPSIFEHDSQFCHEKE